MRNIMNILADYPVIFEQKIAWGDMDAFGHVNNVMYYRYMESARIWYFDHLDIFSYDVNTVVASNQCKYLKPIFYPDVLHIGVRVEELRNSAMRMSYALYSTQQNDIVALGEAVVVFVDKVEMKKTLMPQIIREKIIALENTIQHHLN